MAMVGESCVNEQTIRDLVAVCCQLQADIQSRLELHFDRTGKEPKGEDRPQQPNVLDEIMSDLHDLIESQKYAVEFIASRINPKL